MREAIAVLGEETVRNKQPKDADYCVRISAGRVRKLAGRDRGIVDPIGNSKLSDDVQTSRCDVSSTKLKDKFIRRRHGIIEPTPRRARRCILR